MIASGLPCESAPLSQAKLQSMVVNGQFDSRSGFRLRKKAGFAKQWSNRISYEIFYIFPLFLFAKPNYNAQNPQVVELLFSAGA